MGQSTKFRVRGEVATRRVGDEIVIVPVRAGIGDLTSLYTMNAVGARIWELLPAHSEAEIVGKLTSEFAVSDEAARRDVAQFTSELSAIGLIEEVA